MEIVSIVVSLFLLMFVAYRGYSVILFAPIIALLAAACQGLPIMPTYTELFMTKGVGYVKSFFPVFLLGAVFGKVMEDTNLAKGLSHAIIKKLGHKHAMLSVALAASILTYGGVSMFVVVFAVYPFAAAVFREANIPKRLVPASIALGSFCFTMTCTPGSPQIQNIIPTNFYGTDAFAAPISGMFAAIIIFGGGLWWIESRRKKAEAAGESYGDHTINEPDAATLQGEMPHWFLGILPLIMVLVVNYLLTHFVDWDPKSLEHFTGMKLPLMVTSIKKVVGVWALLIALVVGILTAILSGRKTMNSMGALKKSLNAGALGSLLAIMNTASEVGYGNVIAGLPGFKSITHALMGIQIGGSPLMSEAISVTTLAGVTGSASGGMSIALDVMSKDWMAWANTVGMSPEILHRVASIASGGLDTLPHNGAIITLLAVCGLTHKESYKDLCVVTLLIPFVTSFLVIIFHSVTGLL